MLIKGLSELKVKETDRIESILYNLHQVGVKITATPEDAICVEGGFHCNKKMDLKSFGDHRTAMSAIILGTVLDNCYIDDVSCIKKSFPDFLSLLESLRDAK
jgi:3-phosphoshikimate 1-carboxyvinyltransferase